MGTLSGVEVQLRRLPYVSSESFFVCCDVSQEASIRTWLQRANAVECGCEAVKASRIEMGVPVYGQDVTIDNLPQEIARDQYAISFTKGCYLGQETVARIDALGHVNRRLLGLRFCGDRLAPGDRFRTLERELGEAFVGVEIPDQFANKTVPFPPHGVLTEHLIDAPGQPTRDALDLVLDLFRRRLLAEESVD